MTDDDIPESDSESIEPVPDFLNQEYSVSKSHAEQSRLRKPLVGLIADCGAKRFWASECDFVLAAISSMLLVIILPDFDPLLKGLTFYLFYLLYYQCTEYFCATPGKWWFGLCVRTFDGRRASFSQIGIRTLFRVVEANPLVLGLLPGALFVIFTRRHIRLGDWFAGTVVVRVQDANRMAELT